MYALNQKMGTLALIASSRANFCTSALQGVQSRGRPQREAEQWTGDSLAGPRHLESGGTVFIQEQHQTFFYENLFRQPSAAIISCEFMLLGLFDLGLVPAFL